VDLEDVGVVERLLQARGLAEARTDGGAVS
jgi:hypothetical protein